MCIQMGKYGCFLYLSESENVKECIPDYAGPCYADDECCTENCSNFICRPPGTLENNIKMITDQ